MCVCMCVCMCVFQCTHSNSEFENVYVWALGYVGGTLCCDGSVGLTFLQYTVGLWSMSVCVGRNVYQSKESVFVLFFSTYVLFVTHMERDHWATSRPYLLTRNELDLRSVFSIGLCNHQHRFSVGLLLLLLLLLFCVFVCSWDQSVYCGLKSARTMLYATGQPQAKSTIANVINYDKLV